MGIHPKVIVSSFELVSKPSILVFSQGSITRHSKRYIPVELKGRTPTHFQGTWEFEGVSFIINEYYCYTRVRWQLVYDDELHICNAEIRLRRFIGLICTARAQDTLNTCGVEGVYIILSTRFVEAGVHVLVYL